MNPVGDRISSGVPDVDALLGGLILGDNVVWVVEDVNAVRHLEDALVREILSRGERCFYVSAASEPARVHARFGSGVTVLDARARGRYGDAAVLETAIIEGARSNPPGYVVIDGLVRFAHRWGSARRWPFSVGCARGCSTWGRSPTGVPRAPSSAPRSSNR